MRRLLIHGIFKVRSHRWNRNNTPAWVWVMQFCICEDCAEMTETKYGDKVVDIVCPHDSFWTRRHHEIGCVFR